MSSLWTRLDSAFAAAFRLGMGPASAHTRLALLDVSVNETWDPDRGDNPRLTAERATFIAEHATQATNGGFVFAGDPRHRWINPVLYPLEEAKACWRRVNSGRAN